MIALAAVALAVSAQAASFNWKTGMGGQVYHAGTTTTANGMVAYLFDAAVTSQSDAFAALSAGTAVTSIAGSLDSATLSSGKITTKTAFNWGEAGDTLSAYFVVVNGEHFCISSLQSSIADRLRCGSCPVSLLDCGKGSFALGVVSEAEHQNRFVAVAEGIGVRIFDVSTGGIEPGGYLCHTARAVGYGRHYDIGLADGETGCVQHFASLDVVIHNHADNTEIGGIGER